MILQVTAAMTALAGVLLVVAGVMGPDDGWPHAVVAVPLLLSALCVEIVVASLARDDGPPDFCRAGGDTVCGECGEKFYDHPDHPYRGYDDRPVLKVLCNGNVVKL